MMTFLLIHIRVLIYLETLFPFIKLISDLLNENLKSHKKSFILKFYPIINNDFDKFIMIFSLISIFILKFIYQ